MKKLASLVLALALCLGLTVPALAAPGDFNIQDGVLLGYFGTDTDVTVPDGVTTIGYRVFSNNNSVVSITIPEGVTTIEAGAFMNCPKLTAVHLPSTVTGIGSEAFMYCEKLESTNIPAGVTVIEASTFSSCRSLAGITIPNTVTTIKANAFQDCVSLTGVTIPGSVTTIDICAFLRCSGLTDITIPDSVTSLGGAAFQGCTALKSVKLSSGITEFVSGGMFAECSSLTSVAIPDTFTAIPTGMFISCSALKSVSIPAGVTAIPADVFHNCDALTDVYYGGSQAQWQAVSIDNSRGGNKSLLNAAVHYNSTLPGTAAEPSAPSAPSAPVQTGSVSANPNSSAVLVNGENVAFDAYTIDGSNYFKLRDLAYVLNGTEKQFAVGWDNASKTIALTSGQANTAVGGERRRLRRQAPGGRRGAVPDGLQHRRQQLLQAPGYRPGPRLRHRLG